MRVTARLQSPQQKEQYFFMTTQTIRIKDKPITERDFINAMQAVRDEPIKTFEFPQWYKDQLTYDYLEMYFQGSE